MKSSVLVKYAIALILLLFSTKLCAQPKSDYDLQIELPQSNYFIGFDTSSNDFTLFQENLSAEEKIAFLNTRNDFLLVAAKALQSIKLGFGLGIILKEKIQFIAEKKQINQLYNEAQLLRGTARDEFILATQAQEENFKNQNRQNNNPSLKDKSDLVVLNILKKLDAKLWSQSAIVAHSNEFGVMMAVGAIAEGGKSSGQGWGGLADLGISLGYNKDQKALVFQIFRDVEKFSSTEMPAVFLAGLVGKAGIVITNQNKEMNLQGTSFYPPLAPGYSMNSQRSFSVGASSGLTWPPSPLGDLLTYSNRFQQNTWLRITISPLVKGFFRGSSGLFKDLKPMQLYTVEFFQKIFSKIRNHQSAPAGRCETLFN